MEKINWLFLFLFAFTIAACDDGAEPTDTVHPVVSIISPEANDTLLVYEENEIKVNITDNRGLKDVRVYTADPECDSTCIPQEIDGEMVSISKDNGSVKWDLTIHIPPGYFLGTHVYTVEAEDWQQNVTKSSYPFTVLAPDLDFASFSTTISKGAFGKIDDNNNASLNYNELGAAFYSKVYDVDMEIEADEEDWNWFVNSYGLENQTWSDWDTNGDDFLQPKEFSKGLEKAGFLAEWDLDNDGLLSEEEFVSYLFSRLDYDGNGVLSSNEYVQVYQNMYWL